jgi:hypothetical protein
MTDQQTDNLTPFQHIAAALRETIAELRDVRAQLADARSWARHGYEIGQRHCGWTDHGVAPAWLTEGWPTHIDSCQHSAELAAAETRIAAVRAIATEHAAGEQYWDANAVGIGEEILAALDGPADTPARPAALSHTSEVWEGDDGWNVSCRDCPAYVDNIGSSGDAEDWADEHKAQATAQPECKQLVAPFEHDLQQASRTAFSQLIDGSLPPGQQYQFTDLLGLDEATTYEPTPEVAIDMHRTGRGLMVATYPHEEIAAEAATLAAWLQGMLERRVADGITPEWLGRIEHDSFPVVVDNTLPPGEIHLRSSSTAPTPEVTLSIHVDGEWQEVPGVTAVSVDRDPWVTLTSGTVTIGTGPDAYTVHLGEQAPRPRGLAQVFAEAIDRVALTLTEPLVQPFPDVRARVAAILASTPRCPARFTAGPPELTDDQCAREPGHFGQHSTADRLWTWAPSGPAGHRTNPLYDSLLMGSARPAAVPSCCVCGSYTHGGRAFYENYQGRLFCWPCADGRQPACPLGDQCDGVDCPRRADRGPRPSEQRPAGWCPTCEGQPRQASS